MENNRCKKPFLPERIVMKRLVSIGVNQNYGGDNINKEKPQALMYQGIAASQLVAGAGFEPTTFGL